MKDQIYDQTHRQLESFEFDARVAEVFDDMIERSVPGYRTSISTIAMLARRCVPDGGRVYDLGASLGAASLAVADALSDKAPGTIVAVDLAPAMLSQWAAEAQARSWTIEQRCQDLTEIAIERANLVILNYTLQFVAPASRAEIIGRVAEGLEPSGVLVLSEKIQESDKDANEKLIELHHDFKRAQGYSDLAISQKRDSLEGVLIPETVATHEARLRSAGFEHVVPWYRCWNFVSWLAWK